MQPETDKGTWLWLALLVGLLVFRFGGCELPTTITTSQVTAVTFTYDDKKHFVPPPVAAALDKLNRAGIEADLDEVDTSNPSGTVPKQFAVSRPAAIAAGLPSLVVLAGDKVLRVVKDPKTEEAVIEAAK